MVGGNIAKKQCNALWRKSMTESKSKKLSDLMLIANFLSTLFYSVSYPYIYAETVKLVPKYYISLEQILACIGTIIFCKMWNTYSDRLFIYYREILYLEIIADTVLFADVIIRKDLSFYFLLNIIIYSIITRNLSCGGTKMRAIVNPTEKLREKYDNNSSIVASVATLLGSGAAVILDVPLMVLFILAFIGNIVDNLFYLYIYRCVKHDRGF